MNLLRLLGFGRPAAPAWSGPPDATPIHAWLDAAGFPWRETRADLAARLGVRPDPAYRWNVIEIPTSPPLLQGLIGPLSAQVFDLMSPRMPAARFSGLIHFSDDPRVNIRRAAAEIEPRLGPTRVGPENNTIKAQWRFGPASVTLMVWPRDLRGYYDTGVVEAEQRDPRIAAACHVIVETGYRAPLSAQERAWVESFRSIDQFRRTMPHAGRDLRNRPASEGHLEFVRYLPEDLDGVIGHVGMSADGEALIFCNDQLQVVPMTDVLGLRVERLMPGRGGGGEWLQVQCRTGYDAQPTKWLEICHGMWNAGLADASPDIARKLGRPLEMGEPDYDV